MWLRIVITTDDVVIGWVDVFNISLLENRFEFPSEGYDGDDFKVVTKERSETRRRIEYVIAWVVMAES
jgi:hypothetical protein